MEDLLWLAMPFVLLFPMFMAALLTGRWQHRAVQNRQASRHSLVSIVSRVAKYSMLSWLIVTALFLLVNYLFGDKVLKANDYYSLIPCMLGSLCLSFGPLGSGLLFVRVIYRLPFADEEETS